MHACLPPYVNCLSHDARLVLCHRYIKFKQGEVWAAIYAEFEATGMRPTAPDRQRLASGIELSQSLARVVRETQAAILKRDADEAAQRCAGCHTLCCGPAASHPFTALLPAANPLTHTGTP